MLAYKCFLLGGDGRIADVVFAECSDDDEAIAWAARVCGRRPGCKEFEVWQDDRIVRSGPPHRE